MITGVRYFGFRRDAFMSWGVQKDQMGLDLRVILCLTDKGNSFLGRQGIAFCS